MSIFSGHQPKTRFAPPAAAPDLDAQLAAAECCAELLDELLSRVEDGGRFSPREAEEAWQALFNWRRARGGAGG